MYVPNFLYSVTWVNIHGTVYKPGTVVVLSNCILPEFGEILELLMYTTYMDKSQCLFMCKLYVTNSFNAHFHSFEVYEDTSCQTVFVSQSNLADYHVLSIHSLSSFPHIKFIPCKYHIIENI